jgi:hypothetical protein
MTRDQDLLAHEELLAHKPAPRAAAVRAGAGAPHLMPSTADSTR